MRISGFKLSVLAGLFLGVQSAIAAPDLTPVKVGHLVALDMAPMFLAKESGCFAQNGLDVETVFFANPGDNNAALAGGTIDFSFNPFTLPFFAANSGIPIRVIASAGGWGIMQVVAAKPLGLNDMEDLKRYTESGKPKLKIATLQGDTLELILTREFAHYGIDPNSVEFVYFNDLLAMVEAFRSGQVDILSHIKPYTSEMVIDKGSTVLTDNAKAWTPHTPNAVISVLQKTLEQRPQVVESFLKGMQCGADIINNDPARAVAILSKGNYFKVSPAVLLAAFESAPEPVSFDPDLQSIQSVVDDLKKLGYIQGDVKAADIFDLSELHKTTGE